MRTSLSTPARLVALVALLLAALSTHAHAQGDPFAVAAVDPASLSVTVTGTVLPPAGESYTPLTRPIVRASNQEGEGASTVVAADGSFSVAALPGAILITVIVTNQAWDDPTDISGLIYYAEEGASVTVDADPSTTAIDPIQLVEKTSAISGVVTVAGSATPAAAIPVRAWRLDGAEFEQTVTAADGSYSLPLIAGSWMLRAVPGEEQAFVPAEPPQRVTVADGATVTRTLTVAAADLVVQGRAVDSATGQPVSTLDGRVYSLFRDGDGRPAAGVGPTAPLVDGAFTLKLASSVATTYTVGLYLPADAGYAAQARVVLNVASVPAQLDLPVAANNATISGSLRTRSGAALTGVAGAVYGAGEGGAWSRARVNPATGAYSLPVTTSDRDGEGGTTWAVRAFVDPTSGYLVQRPRGQRVFVPFNSGDGVDVTGVDFTAVALSEFGVVRGRVAGPGPGGQSVPLPGVRVSARPAGESAGSPTRWGYTNLQGEFELRVPAGAYVLSAHDSPVRAPTNRLIEPAPRRVTVTAQQALGGQNLTFRASDAVITGTVSYNGAPYAALVRARSADGATVHVRAGGDGAYRLPLLAGLAWTVEAVSSDESTFLRSAKATVTPAAGANPALPLALLAVEELPESQAFAFDAAADQIFELGDGSRVEAPAGAFASSGQAVLTVRPLPELQSVAGAQPISFGYRLHAYLEGAGGHQPVTRFSTPVTLAIPFTADELAALGITAEQLVPAYWDEASASWKPVETVSVITDATGGGEVLVSVEHFTDYALVTSGERRVYLPAVLR